MAASFPAGGETLASSQSHQPSTTHSLPQRAVSINVSEPSGQTGGLHPLHHPSAGGHGSSGGPKLSRWAALRSDSKDSAPAPSAATQRTGQQVDSTNKVGHCDTAREKATTAGPGGSWGRGRCDASQSEGGGRSRLGEWSLSVVNNCGRPERFINERAVRRVWER